MRSELAVAVLAVAAIASLPAQAADWDASFYNRAAARDDVLLPMPCGGAMAFRRVQVPGKGPLDDYRVMLGGNDEAQGYIEHAHPEWIAGGFSGPGGSHYLIGKYEVTALQYAAVMDPQCPTPSMQMTLPQTRLGWFDAVDFSNRYSLWLREHAAKALPKSGDERGYVRLPTEAEWEYAARGGIAVSESEFRDRLFPMPDGIARYVWFSGASSANGRAQPVGLHEPNPLGLHDMLGNVEEIVFEPFRLNKLDRLSGAAGSFIIRGGSFLTPQAEIRSSYRQEAPYYESAALRRSKTTGFRVAVSAPALASAARVQQLREAWQALGADAGGQGGKLSGQSLSDPVAELQTLAQAAEDPAMKQRLESLRGVLRANLQARDEQRDRAAKSALRLGAFLCIKLHDDGRYLDERQATFDRLCDGGKKDGPACQGLAQQLPQVQRALALNLQYYADTIVGSAQNYPPEVLRAQAQTLRQEVSARGLASIADYGELYLGHALGYAGNGRIARQDWLNACKSAP